MPSTLKLYGKTRRAWLTLPRLDVVIYIGSTAGMVVKETNDDPYEHDPVYIDMVSNRRKFFIPLTTYTSEELLALRTIFNAAFDAAEPVVASLDRVARERMDAGDELLAPRVFRVRPVLVIRDMMAQLAGAVIRTTKPTTREKR